MIVADEVVIGFFVYVVIVHAALIWNSFKGRTTELDELIKQKARLQESIRLFDKSKTPECTTLVHLKAKLYLVEHKIDSILKSGGKTK